MPKSVSRISDLTPDRNNANKGTERGQYMIETSLRKVGPGKGPAIDRNGKIIAGNKTIEAWASMANDDDIIIVQSDGTKLVLVQRTDLDLDDPDDTTAREMAYYDNRSSEVSLDWDAEVLLADLNADVPLGDFFRDDELSEIMAEFDAPEFKEYDESIADTVEMTTCIHCGKETPK